MTTDYKVTELFCIIDEFCKHFDAGRKLCRTTALWSWKAACSSLIWGLSEDVLA